MAEGSMQVKLCESNEVTEDFDVFCKNLKFLETSSCCQCNGFYGNNFGQPLCASCHKFLCSPRRRKRLRGEMDYLSNPNKYVRNKYVRIGNSNRKYILLTAAQPSRLQPQLKDLNTFFNDFIKRCDNETNALDDHPSTSSTFIPIDQSYSSDTNISVLPVEILLTIFSFFDDITLFEVSKVCQQWNQIVETEQDLWKKYTKKRWPVLQRNPGNTNWYKLYSTLLSSCVCRTCAIQMMLKSQNNKEYPHLRRTAERNVMAKFSVTGIRAVPLSRKLAHWQASIAGPADSPYENGIFYLHIYLPFHYPFDPPTVKFLTKIIHPNVSRHGDIGLDVITWNYCFALTITPILLSIQSLLCDPYTEVCMEPELGRLYDCDRPRFNALARDWTKKYAMIDGINFN